MRRIMAKPADRWTNRDHDGLHHRAALGRNLHGHAQRSFKTGYPSSAFMEARKLKTPGAMIEIQAIAVVKE